MSMQCPWRQSGNVDRVPPRAGARTLYGALAWGWINPHRLRRSLAGLPTPRADNRQIILTIDVSPWLRAAPLHRLGSEHPVGIGDVLMAGQYRYPGHPVGQ